MTGLFDIPVDGGEVAVALIVARRYGLVFLQLSPQVIPFLLGVESALGVGVNDAVAFLPIFLVADSLLADLCARCGV